MLVGMGLKKECNFDGALKEKRVTKGLEKDAGREEEEG